MRGVRSNHIQTLDVLRGIAALAVVIFHFGSNPVGRGQPIWSVCQNGYLAVDFFFILSGFVVAHAYEERLRCGMGWASFVRKRFIRLYPLAILGVISGTCVLLAKHVIEPSHLGSMNKLWLSIVLNSALLPTMFHGTIVGDELFPGNLPLWSLFFEVSINLLWARCAATFQTRYLIAFSVLNLIALLLMVHDSDTINRGTTISRFWVGAARVGFGFTAGVVLYRLNRRIRLPNIPFATVLLSTALMLIFGVAPKLSMAQQIIAVVLFFPIIVLIGVNQTRPTSKFGIWLGAMSYPIYVLHYPFVPVGDKMLGARKAHALAISAALFVAMCLTSYLALKLYDEPLRRWMSKKNSVIRPETLDLATRRV